MFTICTECHRQFRIRADQLNAAAGQVMCGYCGTQFDALLNLSDFPSTPSKITETNEETVDETAVRDLDDTVEEETIINLDGIADDDIEPEPTIYSTEFVKPKTEKDKVLDLETAASILESAKQVEVEKEFILSDPDPDEEESLDDLIHDLTAVKDEEPEFEGELQEISSRRPVEELESDDLILHNPYTAEFLEEEETPGVFSIVFWRALALILLLAVGLQFLWFQRDRIMSDYPQTKAYIVQFCEFAKCSVYREQNFSKIKLMSRDVRLHPAYQDSLLVNAVMVNQAKTVMPYPNIQLSLFDTNGNMVSYRQFEPGEYLDKNIDITAGMRSKAPVHFVLELAGHVESAVSFEFDFY